MSESRRLPARVYWVRRFVVLGIPLIIIAVVVWLFVGRDSGEDPAAQDGTSSAAVEPEPSQTPTDTDGVTDCAPAVAGPRDDGGRHLVRAGRQRDVHRRRSPTPATEACLVDAGEAQREIVITSGSDRVWSNRDCIVPGTETRTLLLAGGQTDTTPFAWNRIRSAEGCPPDLPVPGAGTYSAQLNLAGVSAPPSVFGLG